MRLVQDCYRYLDPYYDLFLQWQLIFDKNYCQLPKLLPRQGKILEVGCRRGFLSSLLVYSAENRKVVGIDDDKNEIRMAQRSIISYTGESLKFIPGDITREIGGNIPENAFDGVLCCDLLQRYAIEQQQQILTAIARAMKNGATLVIRYRALAVAPENRLDIPEYLKNLGFVDLAIAENHTLITAVKAANIQCEDLESCQNADARN